MIDCLNDVFFPPSQLPSGSRLLPAFRNAHALRVPPDVRQRPSQLQVLLLPSQGGFSCCLPASRAFRLKFWVDDWLDFPPRLFPRMWSTAICASSSTAWTPTSRKAWPKSWTERRPRSPRNWRTSAPATPSKHLLFSDQDSWDETYCAYLLMHTCNIFVWLFFLFFFTSSVMMQTTFFSPFFFYSVSPRLCCINQTNSRSKTHNGYYIDLSIKSSTIDAVHGDHYLNPYTMNSNHVK